MLFDCFPAEVGGSARAANVASIMPDVKQILKWIVGAIVAALIIAFVAYVKRDVEQRRDAEDRLELKKQIEHAQRERTAYVGNP